MLLKFLPIALLFLAWITASWLDVRYRRVPNWLCGVTALAGLAMGFIEGGAPALGGQALHAAIVLALGMVLFRFGVFGGGDAKFYTGVAAWFGLPKALMLLIAISFCGAVLLFAWFGYRRLRRLPVSKRGGNPFDALPYGIAIGAGAVLTMASALGAGS
jgi:prepilin peptidase CpaA